MANLDRKSLLILGNGADLYMGQPTKWADYWEWRKPYVIDILGIDAELINENYTKYETEPPFYEAFYKKFKYMYKLFDNYDKYSRYGSTYYQYNDAWKKYMNAVLKHYGKVLQGARISNDEAHLRSFPNEKLDELYNFENIVIIERILDKIYHGDSANIDSLNWSDIFFPFLKFIEASSTIKDVDSAEKRFRDLLQSDNNLADHTFNRWWDIEGILNDSTTVLDTLRYGDDKEHGTRGDFFKTDEGPVDGLFELLSELSSLLGTQLELLKRNNPNELMADHVLECYISFENLFKQYLLENLSGFYKDDEYGYFLKELIAHDKHVFRTGSEFIYDILDFNYEPLYRMLSDDTNTLNHKVFGDIYQPHGNVDKSIVIGGNQYKSGPINAKVPLSKTHRNLNLKYEKKDLLYTDLLSKKQQYAQTKSPYKIDLNDYDSIVIYGWSINDIDQAIFAKIADLMDERVHPHHKVDVTVVVNYNDNPKSRSEIVSNIDALMNLAAAKHGEIRFSVLDEAPAEDN